METVEVVIQIPKYEYEKCKREEETIRAYQRQGLDGVTKYMAAILDGTVLPKGHGRLVDADAILEDPYGNTYKDIEIAETIIEADKGGE